MATFNKFTASTPNPLSTPDEFIVRSPVPYDYEDMRGKHWIVTWLGQGWAATPAADAVAAYADMSTGTNWKVAKGSVFAAASDARGIVDGIEERIEMLRVNAKDSGFPWWLALLALWALSKKGRR